MMSLVVLFECLALCIQARTPIILLMTTIAAMHSRQKGRFVVLFRAETR